MDDRFEKLERIFWSRGRGCIHEVDLEYPKKLHDLHNEYPLAPERIEINKVEKLIPNLNEKKKYVLHHKNLKQYLDLGLKLTKIYRGISFDEKAWLKPYIEFNTNLRSKAQNEFEKEFFKLMNNSVFGKTMENIRNRVNIRLVNNQKSLKKCVANQTLIIAMYLMKILSQCTWRRQNWFSINRSISEWVSWICQRPWCMSFIIIT